MTQAQTAVHLRSVTKTFVTGTIKTPVLRGVDLDALCGEITLLVGPSGCGKTTLLCVLSGLLDADEGDINVFGQDLRKLTGEAKTFFRKGNLGFVFQQSNLIPTISAVENAAVPLLIQGMARTEAQDRAVELLKKVGLGERLHVKPAFLSGGEQQRVAIARALVGQPRLLVCDEPTAALDGETGTHVMEILRATALTPERCVLVVTHDSRIFRFGDRIARMLDGRIESTNPLEHKADGSLKSEITGSGRNAI